MSVYTLFQMASLVSNRSEVHVGCVIVSLELPFPELILSRGSVLRQGVWLELAVGFILPPWIVRSRCCVGYQLRPRLLGVVYGQPVMFLQWL